MEHWVVLQEFPVYSVSSQGRLINGSTGRILSPSVTGSGYFQAHLYVKTLRFLRYVHRLVVDAFYDVDIQNYQVNHIDGNKFNNFVGNLEVMTASQNSQHAYDIGLRVRPSMRSVRIVETGEIFECVADCARRLRRSESSVHVALRRKWLTAGFHVEFAESRVM
jgi:hypothetical protein